MSASRHLGSPPSLFSFGLGYSASALATALVAEGWQASGTYRKEEKRRRLEQQGIRAYSFERNAASGDLGDILNAVTDVLVSIPPNEDSDPVLKEFAETLRSMPHIRWIGYLSTTGVYGDTGGAVVDETADLHPTSPRSRHRVAAEQAWLDEFRAHRLPVHIFRLAGIYGPGRSAIDQVRAGDARRIDRPDHLFSRIHVEDIAAMLRASMARPDPGRVYNLCDDEPAAPGDVVDFACHLLGVTSPPLIPFDVAAAMMSPMALSFWHDNRRIDNGRIKRELGIALRYPTYREGLKAILDSEATPAAQ